MTLFQVIEILKEIALGQPNVKSATDGSIYEVMNAKPSVKYDVVHFSQTTHQSDEETDYYGLNIFYVSRLEDSLEDNRLQIQSIGKEILDNIIRTFCENWGIDFPVITYTPFTQRFNDLCAGQYCNLRIEIPKELLCADDYIAEVVPGKDIKLQDLGITITQNGLTVVTPDAEYDGIGEIRIVTDVPQTTADLQYKEVEYTENGEYTVRPDPDYDGLTEVAVSVDVPDNYDEGYNDGKEDGIEEQKAKLTVTSFTENDTYTRADGWSAITVNVPQGQGYEEGYEDGVADQKAKLSGITITENGDYNREDGYSAITVNVPSIITNQEKNIVINDNTNPLTWFPELGAYALQTPLRVSADSGYTGIEPAIVDVYCDASEAIQYGYNEGYADGFAAGASACSGFFITALTLNVDSAITDYGTVTTTYSPESAITNIYYTSSNPSIATIDSGTGVITVLSSGTVTICAKDSITHLQDCKQVTVTKTVPPTPEPADYLTFHITGDGNIVWKCTGSGYGPIGSGKTVEYSKDNGTSWTSITATTGAGTSISVLSGDTVLFRGNNANYDNNTFGPTTSTFYLTGNIMSLINSTDFTNLTVLTYSRTFRRLFNGCTGLTSVKDLLLPATNLISDCYHLMFADCTSLTDAPNLPAMKMSGSQCYSYMFMNCRSLTGAPALPATILSDQCYEGMFYGCTSLTTAPELPAKTLATHCYDELFRGCTSLNYIKCLATNISAAECTDDWTYGVANSGTFVKDPNMSDWTIGESGIPSGWTITDNT